MYNEAILVKPESLIRPFPNETEMGPRSDWDDNVRGSVEGNWKPRNENILVYKYYTSSI